MSKQEVETVQEERRPSATQRTALLWILRIGVAATFVGHGMFAWKVNPGWISYLTTVGFSQDAAASIMPIIGVIDIVVAMFVIFRPIKIVLIYAVVWTLITALIRPLAGEAIWTFVERGANWAAPLALLLLQGTPSDWKELFRV